MDTRKLEILKNDQALMLSLAEPGVGGEVIARIDPATVHSDQLREVRRRYNLYPSLEELRARLAEVLIWGSEDEEENEMERPEDGETDSHDVLMHLVRLARKIG